MSVGQTDPVLQFPYKVYEHTINNIVVVYANDAAWTRAMKFILTDLKWLIAWAVKHGASSWRGCTLASTGEELQSGPALHQA